MDPSAANGLAAVSGLLMLAFVVFGIVLSILWVLVPFAIFGIKPLLRTLIAKQNQTNGLLEAMLWEIRAQNEEPSRTPAPTHNSN